MLFQKDPCGIEALTKTHGTAMGRVFQKDPCGIEAGPDTLGTSKEMEFQKDPCGIEAPLGRILPLSL